MSIERSRLTDNGAAWRHWGPYLSERQWGTVREDYSYNGDAWAYFSHDDLPRRCAYRWGEDGIGGFSDDQQRLCLSLAVWNGRDPILKERLFGLTNAQGNHGEDVKEVYYYLDATPSHSILEDALQVSPAGVSLRRTDHGERKTRQARARVRTAGHRCSTNTATSMSLSNTRRRTRTTC